MEISFSYENINIMIILIGATVILHMLTIRSERKRAIRFSNFDLLKRVAGANLLPNHYLVLFLRIMAIILIVLGLSNFTLILEKKTSNFDFVLSIDTSSSMLTPDFLPNRLEAAKEASLYLLDIVPEEMRIGIVTFAGKPYKKLDLTNDMEEIRKTINKINFETPAGTAIYDSLIMSSLVLSSSNRTKAIIILTDGKNNVGMSVNDTIDLINKNNITVYAIGIGTNQSADRAEINITVNESTTIADFPELDIESLEYISNRTGGRFFLATNRTELQEAYKKALIETKTERINVSYYMLIAGVIMLLLEWALGITRYKTIP